MDDAGAPLRENDVVGGYTIIGHLGSGGMGTVYLVAHPRLPRRQALKVLSSSVGANLEFRERFRREVDLAARLDHPNIVAVQDAGIDGDTMWMAMQYVEGTDAAAILREATEPLPAAPIVDLITQVAAGLDHAHAQGTLHRDVKPANILVTPAWDRPAVARRALIADFGIARLMSESTGLTATGNVIATLAYAAPEMFTDTALTPAVDEYALGCTLYELLTGRAVFDRTDAAGLISAHTYAPVPRCTALRPDLPEAIDDVIAQALAKRPDERHGSAGAFAAAAARAVDANPGPTTIVGDRQPAPATILGPHQTPGRGDGLRPPPPPRGPRPTGVPTAPPPMGVPSAAMPIQPVPAPPVRRRHGVLPWLLAGLALMLVGAIVAVVLVATRGTDTSTGSSPAAASAPTAAPTTGSPTTGQTTPPVAASLAGNWRGSVTGDQTGFDVVAQISDTAPLTATVHYPQLGCAGTWTENSRRGSTVTLTEQITQGTCVTSQIEVTPSADGTVAYRSSYYSQSQGRTLVITSVLRRS